MSNSAHPPSAKRDVWLSVKRGLMLRCPNCGKGKVLAGYLKPAAACGACGESFAEIRADDGPAWATILLVGHLTSPFFFLFATPDAATSFTPFLIVAGAMMAMTLTLLPRMKGLFIGLIWANRAGDPAPGDLETSEQLY
jgi:uncharacterized protein (DUF983 family)